MKIRPVGTELFYADGQTHRQTDGEKDGQTDIRKVIVAFSKFCSLSHKQRRYWGARVKTEMLGSEG